MVRPQSRPSRAAPIGTGALFAGLGLVFGGLITLAPWTEARHGIPAYPLVALAAVVFSIRILLERAPEKRVEALSSTLFGLVYISLLLQYLVRIVTPASGDTVPPAGRLVLCLWVVAVVLGHRVLSMEAE